MGHVDKKYIPFPLNRLKQKPSVRWGLTGFFLAVSSDVNGLLKEEIHCLTYSIALSFDCSRPSSWASSTVERISLKRGPGT